MSRRTGLILICVMMTVMVMPTKADAYATATEGDAFSYEVSQETGEYTEHTPPQQNEFSVEIIREEPPDAAYAGKRVLIYHTHTYEAYQKAENDPYTETETWRTANEKYNIVAVGEALCQLLRLKGIMVEHDTTAFEPPSLEQAYDRSLAMLTERKQSGEVYDLYIDLHRDAVASTATIKRTINIGGEEVARFMVLVGKGTTGGYEEKPDWEKNLRIAQSITAHLNELHEGLARDVKIKTGRFNQHISDACILIECGMNTNTLEQVLAGVPYLAEAIAETLAYQ